MCYCSGDGTLSVIDLRSKKTKPSAQSEDQEDELLSIVAIKGCVSPLRYLLGIQEHWHEMPLPLLVALHIVLAIPSSETVCSGRKVVVGTQIGVLSIFNRNSGWGDCVDRVPGYVCQSTTLMITTRLAPSHPHSVDALCGLPSSIPDVETSSTILTGSSDGLVRAVRVLPTKLLGVVADHGDLPVERIGVGCGGSQLTLEESSGPSKNPKVGKKRENQDEGAEEEDDDQKVRSRWWVGSVGHDEVLRLTDLEAFFHEGKVEDARAALSVDSHVDDDRDSEVGAVDEIHGEGVKADEDTDSGEEEESPRVKKRKHKPEKSPLTVKKKKGKNSVEADHLFFNGL